MVLRCGVALASVWLLAASANAEVPIPKTEDGEGLPVGQRSVVHLGVAVPIGLDSNVFSSDRNEDPQPAGFIYPSAWVGIGNREVRDGLLMSPPERTGRVADYGFSIIGGFRQLLSGDPVVRSQPRFSIGARGRLNLLPGRRFSLVANEDYYYGSDPTNFRVDGRSFNLNRHDQHADVTMYFRPGGGRLSLSLGYLNELLRFIDGSQYRSNRNVNGLLHETKWRFLPKSALVFEYQFFFTRYLAEDIGVGRNESSFAHRFNTGYRGQLQRRLTLDAIIGWGLAFYRADVNGPDFSGLIGNITLSYYPTLESQLQLSLFRDFHDSLWGNYYVDNGVRAFARHTFRFKMIGHAGISVSGRTYHGLPEPGLEDQNIDEITGQRSADLQQRSTVATIDIGVEQPLRRVFSVALSYTLRVDGTDTAVHYTNGVTDELGYIKHLLWFVAAARI